MGCANLEGVVRNFRTSLEQLASEGHIFLISAPNRTRNITLPIIVKIKDQQHQWKKLKLPRRKKERNFTSSFVDNELLEIIGFRDSCHEEKFLPLNGHGTRLAQVHQIHFELCKGIAKHSYMSFDGTKWKQHTPIDDDNYMIEISYSSKTRMLATSTSKCKHKARSPTPIEYSQ
uniref:Diacylglycerol kinase 6 n=1 Tax=Vitis vinifera TaxID=29760 RepID=F6HJM0_VITVI